MRLATKWNDKDLLQDEPFYSALRGRRRTPDSRFFGELVGKVKGLKFGVRSGGIPPIMCIFFDQIVQTRAVQSWVDLAFAPLLPPSGAEKNARLWVDHRMLHFFVEFYWNLAQNECKALTSLNQARRQLGLDDLHPSHIHMAKSAPTAHQMTLLAHKEPYRGPALNEARIEMRTARAYENQGIACSSRVSC
jgi:hypothetical protein